MRDSVEKDVIRRALADVQDYFSVMNDEKDDQRIYDLKMEIGTREKRIEELCSVLEDIERAARIIVDDNPALALVFQFRADLLRDEIYTIRPDSLRIKVKELEKKQKWGKLVGQVLSNIHAEALNGHPNT